LLTVNDNFKLDAVRLGEYDSVLLPHRASFSYYEYAGSHLLLDNLSRGDVALLVTIEYCKANIHNVSNEGLQEAIKLLLELGIIKQGITYSNGDDVLKLTNPVDKNDITPPPCRVSFKVSTKLLGIDVVVSELQHIATNKPRKVALGLLVQAMSRRSGAVSITCNRNDYTKGRYNHANVGCSAMMHVMAALIEDGLVVKVGGMPHKRCTQLFPTEKMLNLLGVIKPIKGILKGSTIAPLIELSESIVLHEKVLSEGKTQFDTPRFKRIKRTYSDNKHIRSLRRKMAAYNKLLGDSEILTAYGRDVITSQAHRVFNYQWGKGFTLGGRLYGDWSSMKPMDRAGITINGNPTVEIDIVASHTNHAYVHLTGQQYNGDAYRVYVNNDLMDRDLVKDCINISFNSNSVRQCIEAVRSKRNNQESYAIVKDVLNACLEMHSPIAEFMLTDKTNGLMIQGWESNTIMCVVDELVKNGIIALPVHDSLIVDIEHRDLIEYHLPYSIKSNQ
jgi:hypothetical protein